MMTRFSHSLRLFFALCVGLGAGVGTGWAVEGIVDIAMVPRLTIVGSVGATHQIQYCTNMSQPSWGVLTNLLVAQNPCRFVDVTAPNAPRRFYRVVKLSPDGMVLIPAGSCSMGDGSDGNAASLPVHTVYVSEFFMDRNEVTKALWDTVKAYNGGNGYSYENAGSGKAGTHPVHSVNWRDCVKWCNARSQREARTPCYYNDAGLTSVYKTGTNVPYVKWNANGYRLPTEAEWEKAARGGATGQRFLWGNTISWAQANYYAFPLSVGGYVYDVNATKGGSPSFNDGVSPYTSPVGCFAPNGYGLHDMAGNVWEWCWDWYASYGSASQSDPQGPASGSARAFRGGSWQSDARDARCAQRYGLAPSSTFNTFGFRAVINACQP